jgi:integrase/recombinase XerD
MEQLFKDSRTLLRMREGPLGDYVDLLAGQLHQQGYAVDTARLWIRLVADFSRWLKRRGIAVERIASDQVGRYLRCRARHHCRRPMDAVYLERFLDVLRREHILAEEHVLIETGAGEQLALGAAALHRGDENFRYMCASA